MNRKATEPQKLDVGSIVPAEEEPRSRETVPEPEMDITVRFTETPGIRLITAEDWEKAGVPGHAETRWDSNNGWCVLKRDLLLNEEQYSRIVRADRYFREHEIPKVSE